MVRRIGPLSLVTMVLVAWLTAGCLDVETASVAFGLDAVACDVVMAPETKSVDEMGEQTPDEIETYGEDAPAPLCHEVSFDACGGTFADGSSVLVISVIVDELPWTPGVLSEGCARDGYELTGWWTKPDGGMRVLDERGVSMVSITLGDGCWELLDAAGACQVFSGQGLELFAHWEPCSYTQTIEVRIQMPDGEFEAAQMAHTEEAFVDELFAWEYPADDVFEGAQVSYVVKGETYTCVDIARKHYQIVYDLGEGMSGPVEYEALMGETIELMNPEDEVSGKTFVGWIVPHGSDECLRGGEFVTDLASSGETVVLEASWKDEVVVTFDLACPSDEIEQELDPIRIADDNSEILVPDVPFERELYDFKGWGVEGESQVRTLLPGEWLQVSSDVASEYKLVAVWEPKQLRIVVPISVTLAVEEDATFYGDCEDVFLVNDSDVAVEVTDVSFDAADSWCLVAQDGVREPNDLSVCLSLGGGTALDVFDTSKFRGEMIGAGDSLNFEYIWGQMGTVPVDDIELGSLSFYFRAVRSSEASVRR